MIRKLGFGLAAFLMLGSVSVMAQDAVPTEPEVTIRQEGDRTVEEYRVNGFLYAIKVTPKTGAPYYLVAVDEDGRKLSKRFGADPVATLPPEQALRAALNFLGQHCPNELSLEATWDWALANWKLSRIPRRLQRPLHPVEAGAD